MPQRLWYPVWQPYWRQIIWCNSANDCLLHTLRQLNASDFTCWVKWWDFYHLNHQYHLTPLIEFINKHGGWLLTTSIAHLQLECKALFDGLNCKFCRWVLWCKGLEMDARLSDYYFARAISLGSGPRERATSCSCPNRTSPLRRQSTCYTTLKTDPAIISYEKQRYTRSYNGYAFNWILLFFSFDIVDCTPYAPVLIFNIVS